MEYFTKPGDRKKYFTINGDHIIQHIDRMIAYWNSDKELHLEMKAFKEKVNLSTTDEDDKFDLAFHNNYISFLDESMLLVSKLKEKMINNQSN